MFPFLLVPAALPMDPSDRCGAGVGLGDELLGPWPDFCRNVRKAWTCSIEYMNHYARHPARRVPAKNSSHLRARVQAICFVSKMPGSVGIPISKEVSSFIQAFQCFVFVSNAHESLPTAVVLRSGEHDSTHLSMLKTYQAQPCKIECSIPISDQQRRA